MTDVDNAGRAWENTTLNAHLRDKEGGSIDLLSSTQNYGDVRADDLTRWIPDTVRGLTDGLWDVSEARDRAIEDRAQHCSTPEQEMSIIREIIEAEGERAGYLRKRGIIPGHRGNSNDPATYQSDLVEAEVERIMDDEGDLADVLECDMARPLAEFLAYCSIHWRLFGSRGQLEKLAVEAGAYIEQLVYKHVEREAGL